jgi:hypothetical protein
VRSSPLLIGEGGDELAAEVGDVGDHAAPDQVGSSREVSGYFSDDLLLWLRIDCSVLAGMFTGVSREAHQKAEAG